MTVPRARIAVALRSVVAGAVRLQVVECQVDAYLGRVMRHRLMEVLSRSIMAQMPAEVPPSRYHLPAQVTGNRFSGRDDLISCAGLPDH